MNFDKDGPLKCTNYHHKHIAGYSKRYTVFYSDNIFRSHVGFFPDLSMITRLGLSAKCSQFEVWLSQSKSFKESHVLSLKFNEPFIACL